MKKMKTIKIIKIDVDKRDVYEIESTNRFDGENGFYQHAECRMLQTVPFIEIKSSKRNIVNDLWVDEMGHVELKTNNFFRIDDEFLRGHGLVAGADDDGESVDHACDIESLKKRITFHHIDELIKLNL